MKKRETPEDAAWVAEFREKYPEEVRGVTGETQFEGERGIVRAGKSWENEELVREWEKREKALDVTRREVAKLEALDPTLKIRFEGKAETPHPDRDANSGVEGDEMAGRIRKSVPKVKEETMSDRKNHEVEEREDEESRTGVEDFGEPDSRNLRPAPQVCAVGGDHEPAESPIPYKSVRMCAKCRCIYVPKV